MESSKDSILKNMIEDIYEQAYESSEMYIGYFIKEICKKVILYWLKIAKEQHVKLV
jgi:hypothetical protein